MSSVVHGMRVAYPNGGCWGVTLEDSLGNYPVLPGLQKDSRLSITLSNKEEVIKRIVEGAPEPARRFLERLLAIPEIGSYLVLQGNCFVFSARESGTPRVDMVQLFPKVRSAFEEAYGVRRLMW
jgi:hypothetical protein